MKRKMKKRTKGLLIVLSVIVVLTAACVSMVSIANTNIETLNSINMGDIGDIDFSNIPDGTYEGSRLFFPVYAKIRMQVKDGKIVDIEMLRALHGEGRGAEAIFNDVADRQSLQVDAVSGATLSSKVTLLAIKDALK